MFNEIVSELGDGQDKKLTAIESKNKTTISHLFLSVQRKLFNILKKVNKI